MSTYACVYCVTYVFGLAASQKDGRGFGAIGWTNKSVVGVGSSVSPQPSSFCKVSVQLIYMLTETKTGRRVKVAIKSRDLEEEEEIVDKMLF